MSKFEIGDKVREIATGDEGIIKGTGYHYGECRVNWTTGRCKGCDLVISESSIEHVLENTVEITFQQALDFLLQSGYKVQLEKI